MPPNSPDDDLPPADDLPLPKEDPSDTTTGVLEEEMPADDDTKKPYDDSEGDDAPVPPPAEEGEEPADPPAEDTNTTSLDQPQWREWVDASGQHSTKAVLVAVDLAAGKISIRKENGKRIGVPLVKLSQADQDFVRSLAPSVASTAP